jgi:hypothetical protein
MYGRAEGRQSRAAQTAEAELRRGLEQLASAGLLRIGVDEATAVTTAEDEESATLATMPAQMADALGRRRRGSA